MNIVVLISGYGSNLKAIVDYINKKKLNINISAVISNNPDANGLNIASQNHIKTYTIPNDKNYNLSLLEIIKPIDPNYILLAGFMRILSEDFVNNFENRIINIHPSLLPKYPGLNTHEKVLKNKDKEHGCTIHIVTKDLDSGPILAQAKCDVDSNDTVDNLKSKVQKLEHELYPRVIEELAANL